MSVVANATPEIEREWPRRVVTNYFDVDGAFVIFTMCPVCGKFGASKLPFDAWKQRDLMAVSDTYEGDDGRPVYLRTCDKHDLADVHRMYHPYRIRERGHRR